MKNSITLSELQDNPGAYIHHCKNEPLAVTKHGKPVYYLVTPDLVQTRNVFVGSLSTNFSSTAKEDHEEDHTHQ